MSEIKTSSTYRAPLQSHFATHLRMTVTNPIDEVIYYGTSKLTSVANKIIKLQMLLFYYYQ